MRPRSQIASRFALVVFAFSVSACERGCLSAWLADRSGSPMAGGEDPRGSKHDAAAAAVDLTGKDCSDGLARCVAGNVETSILAHAARGDCPWEFATTCPRGCVQDGLEVLAAPEVAGAQLCNAPVTEQVTRPVLPSETVPVTICADEVVSCSESVVRSCASRGQPARAVIACTNGCAAGIAIEPGDLATGDGPASILCRRAHAERR